jgi:hypothetical protein
MKRVFHSCADPKVGESKRHKNYKIYKNRNK